MFDYLNAVHENVFHSDRVLMRLFEDRAVSNRGRIEYNHIGKHTFLEKAAIIEPEICCWQSAQPVHGFS